MSKVYFKADYLTKIRRDDVLKLQLAQIFDVKVSTIDRWLREEDLMLTTATALEVIKIHFGIDEISEILESEVVEKA